MTYLMWADDTLSPTQQVNTMPRYVIERDIPEKGSADLEALIQEHAERSGFPATEVTEVRKMIDPITSDG
jgi:hypothetical protein